MAGRRAGRLVWGVGGGWRLMASAGAGTPATNRAREAGTDGGRGETTQMKTGTALIDYIGGLVLAGGDHDGAPFDVLPWERRFIRGAFGQPGHAALSVARGNGKSALVAAIAAAVADPDGPLHGNRREVVCVRVELRPKPGDIRRRFELPSWST